MASYRCVKLPVGSLVQLSHILPVEPDDQDAVPAEVVDLLVQFVPMFESAYSVTTPSGLRARDSFGFGCCSNHVRLYRYPPATKGEIERQVSQTLSIGVIRPSSMFSLSILFVQKKDDTFHFCVDLRHLNTIIVKNHCPVPIIEELLDELSKASWVS